MPPGEGCCGGRRQLGPWSPFAVPPLYKGQLGRLRKFARRLRLGAALAGSEFDVALRSAPLPPNSMPAHSDRRALKHTRPADTEPKRPTRGASTSRCRPCRRWRQSAPASPRPNCCTLRHYRRRRMESLFLHLPRPTPTKAAGCLTTPQRMWCSGTSYHHISRHRLGQVRVEACARR